MSYHPLANDTGGATDDRRAEADRLRKIIQQLDLDAMTPTERDFVERIEEGPVSPKQLFWLRDIKDKYL